MAIESDEIGTGSGPGIVTPVEACLNELRWNKDGKLEQLWKVYKRDAYGVFLGDKNEWRVVPTEAAS